MKRIFVLLAAVPIGMGACGAGGARLAGPTPSYYTQENPPPHVVEHGAAVGSPRASFIENLPVPDGFRLRDQDRDGFDLSAWYEAPEGVTIDDLLVWYRSQVHAYSPWHDWSWCTGVHNSPGPTQGIWGWTRGADELQTLHAVVTRSEDKVVIHLSRGSTGMCANG